MSAPEFVQHSGPSSDPGTRHTPARRTSREGPGAGPPIPTPRRSGEEQARSPISDDSLTPDGNPSLNAHDLELLRHLADGMSTPQIAAAMSVTSNTTRTRIRRVQRKLGACGREQVVEAAHERTGI